jgi:hypothetical protein
MKTLCFTTSYNRPYFLYNTINSILNQTYHDFHYCVNVNLNNINEKPEYEFLLNDFVEDKRLKIIYNKNNHQQINYTNAMNGMGDNNYDLFIKIDDDDIYHKKYIEKSLDFFKNENCDILSFTCKHHINNNKIKNQIKSIGDWKGDANTKINFGMPPTFIFNKKAFDVINKISISESKSVHPFEDGAWKQNWRKHNLKSVVIEDQDIFTYNIHQQNTSSTFLLDHNPSLIDTEFATVVQFSHPHWTSYVYLNKRNNKLYNIQNDDHGVFYIQKNEIIITWENWDYKEVYSKEYIGHKLYKYNFSKSL